MSDTRRLHALLEGRGVPWRTTMLGETEWSLRGVTLVAVVREGTGEVILTAYPVTVDGVAALMEWMDERKERE